MVHKCSLQMFENLRKDTPPTGSTAAVKSGSLRTRDRVKVTNNFPKVINDQCMGVNVHVRSVHETAALDAQCLGLQSGRFIIYGT